jgi:hypothetical protein
MANLKYPSGLKVKAPLAWLTALIGGFAPFVFFFPTYMIKEHYTGNTPRKLYGEDR